MKKDAILSNNTSGLKNFNYLIMELKAEDFFKKRTWISGKFIFATTCIHRSSTYCNDFPPYFLAQCVAVVSRYVQKCTHTIALSDVVTSTYIPTSSYL